MSYSNSYSNIGSKISNSVSPRKSRYSKNSNINVSRLPYSLTPGSLTYEQREKRMPMAVMADEIFGVSDIDDYCVSAFDEGAIENSLLTNDEHKQLELPLGNPNDLLQEHRSAIYRYERAYEKMSANALRWHFLMLDAEHNCTIAKMLNDIQVLRKLSGGTVF